VAIVPRHEYADELESIRCPAEDGVLLPLPSQVDTSWMAGGEDPRDGHPGGPGVRP
jgi:hypothetical protein